MTEDGFVRTSVSSSLGSAAIVSSVALAIDQLGLLSFIAVPINEQSASVLFWVQPGLGVLASVVAAYVMLGGRHRPWRVLGAALALAAGLVGLAVLLPVLAVAFLVPYVETLVPYLVWLPVVGLALFFSGSNTSPSRRLVAIASGGAFCTVVLMDLCLPLLGTVTFMGPLAAFNWEFSTIASPIVSIVVGAVSGLVLPVIAGLDPSNKGIEQNAVS